MLNLRETIEDMQQRIDNPATCSVVGKLTGGILHTLNASSPMRLPSDEFNLAAETYYRENLRKSHLAESFQMWEERFLALFSSRHIDDNELNSTIQCTMRNRDITAFLLSIKKDILEDNVPVEELTLLIYLVLVTIDYNSRLYEETPDR